MPVVDYEVTYILRPALEEAQVDEVAKQLAENLKKTGGEPGRVDKLGKKRLAYEIDDLREGHYVVMRFRSDGVQSKELERQMRLNEHVMRALVIKLDKIALAAQPPAPSNSAPSAIAAQQAANAPQPLTPPAAMPPPAAPTPMVRQEAPEFDAEPATA